MNKISITDINKKQRTTKHDMQGYISQYIFNVKRGYDMSEITIDIEYKNGREERFTDRLIEDLKLPNMSEIKNVIYSDSDATFDLFTRNILTDEEIRNYIDIGLIEF